MGGVFVKQFEYRGGQISAPPGAPVLITPAETAVWDLKGVALLLDAKFAETDADDYVVSMPSGKPLPNGAKPKLLPTQPVSGPPELRTTTDGQKGIGRKSGDVSGHGTLIGDENAKWPASPWLLCVYMEEGVGNTGIPMCTDGVTGQVAIDFDTTNQVYIYADFDNNVRRGSGTGWNDGNPHLYTFYHDGTNATLYKDGVSPNGPGALAATAEGTFRTGTIDDTNGGGATNFDAFDGTWEYAVLIDMSVTDAPTLAAVHNAVRAVILERHPGMTITAL